MPSWKKVITSGSIASLEEVVINKQGATTNEKLLEVKSSNSPRLQIQESGNCYIYGTEEKGSLSINQDRDNSNGTSLLNLAIENASAQNTVIFIEEDGVERWEIQAGGSSTHYMDMYNGDILSVGKLSTRSGTSGIVDIQGTLDASNATGDTGALRVEGGASIAKKIYCGSDIISTEASKVISGSATSTGSFGHLMVGGGDFTSASLAAGGGGGGGGGSMSDFTLTADAGADQTIADGQTLDIAGGTNITTAVGSTDTVTVNLDASPSITNLSATGIVSSSQDLRLGYKPDAGSYISASSDGTIEMSGSGAAAILNVEGAITASAISASGDLTSNDLYLDEYIYHQGNETTYIKFTDNVIATKANNVSFIKMDGNSGQKELTINDGPNDIDFVVKGASNNPLLKTDSANNRIGTNGIGTPTADFHMGGNLKVVSPITASAISSSGALLANTLTVDGLSTQASEVTAVTINGSNVFGTRDLGTAAFTATTAYATSAQGSTADSAVQPGGALGTPSSGTLTNCTFPTLNQSTTGTAAIATTVTITDNENEDEDNAIVFTSAGDVDGGNLGLESDGDLTYNPSTGTLTTTVLNTTTNKFTKTGTTDAEAQGDVVYFGGTTSMDNGKIYHYKSDGTWELANADDVSTADGLLAVALGAASDTNGMLLRGMVTLDHDNAALGDVLYVQSDNAGTPGEATATKPAASGDIVRVIGYCLDASNGQVWFNPDNTFVEVA